jgi:hypothetical protein
MNYTIRLTHGSAFWTTIFDATGASWSSGPFHAGTNQDVGCLATLTGQKEVGGVMADRPKSGGGVGIGALAGGIVGAFLAGLVLAALAMIFLAKKKRRRSHVRPSYLSSSSPTSISPSLPIIQKRDRSISFLCSMPRANIRTGTDPPNPWTATTIPKSAQQPGDPIPTPPSPNPNQ